MKVTFMRSLALLLVGVIMFSCIACANNTGNVTETTNADTQETIQETISSTETNSNSTLSKSFKTGKVSKSTHPHQRNQLFVELNQILLQILFTLNYQFQFQPNITLFQPKVFFPVKSIYHNSILFHQFTNPEILLKKTITSECEDQVYKLIEILQKEQQIKIDIGETNNL